MNNLQKESYQNRQTESYVLNYQIGRF